MSMTEKDSKIVCIWYPSGGFGHFVNAVISAHGAGFACSQKHIGFGPDGNSHAFPLSLPKYFRNPKHYDWPPLEPDTRYTALVDNGINDESQDFKQVFRDAAVIRICYDDLTWPIVARCMIEKAMQSRLDDELMVDTDAWPCKDDWSVREKYFLFLRDHPFRHRWRPMANCYNFDIQRLLQYETALEFLQAFSVGDTFRSDWTRWIIANNIYINPVQTAAKVVYGADGCQDISNLSIWEQSVINYYVWLRYHIEIPANDLVDWFETSEHLCQAILSLQTASTSDA